MSHVPTTTSSRLVVFSDDWGRHPSSCQHLVTRLLDRHAVLWVNTIGTRIPRLSREDLGKTATKLRQWLGGRPARRPPPPNLRVLNPPMYPGFRTRWQRRLNASLIRAAVHRALGPRVTGVPRIAVTTIPVTADLVGRLDVDRWVYYCVDDFSVWPGLDGHVLDQLDRDLVARVDRVVCVSRTLRERVAGMGADAALLTHGIDLEHWRSPVTGAPLPAWWKAPRRPVALFWGVIDRRLDTACCRALAEVCGTLLLVGPRQAPAPDLCALSGVTMPGPVDYDDLPALAGAADVLVMPYADLPVTRAMQPLKLKEYLATGRPVVVRALPATQPWRDAADVVDDATAFAGLVEQRARSGVPEAQRKARERLGTEGWAEKARAFEHMLFGGREHRSLITDH